jgi:hypothetical protein
LTRTDLDVEDQGRERLLRVMPVDRRAIHDEMEQAKVQFHGLLGHASPADLRRGSQGTRWTNQELLFHMLFGYIVVKTLLRLVRIFGRLPDGSSRVFAMILNSATRPFHVINYLGSCGGALVFRGKRLASKLDRTIDSLHRRLEAEDEAALHRVMHFPVGWDPYFKDVMSLADVYHYATQHFQHHRRQLTIS